LKITHGNVSQWRVWPGGTALNFIVCSSGTTSIQCSFAPQKSEARPASYVGVVR
jgi:hypothetical protein